MGLFSKLKSKFNSAAGLGKNNELFDYIGGGGTALLAKAEKGGLTDAFLGKKEGGRKADSIAGQLKATQGQGLKELNNALNTDASSIVGQQVEAQKQGVLTSAQDARRNAQKMMAQQGLKGTSLGLASQRSIDQNTGNQVAAINSQVPALIRDQSIQDAKTRIAAGGLANAGNIQFQDVEGRRSGGILGIASSLAPLVGTIGGAMAGGPAGAAVGGQLGGSIGSSLAPTPAQQGAYNPNKYSMGNYNF